MFSIGSQVLEHLNNFVSCIQVRNTSWDNLLIICWCVILLHCCLLSKIDGWPSRDLVPHIHIKKGGFMGVTLPTSQFVNTKLSTFSHFPPKNFNINVTTRYK